MGHKEREKQLFQIHKQLRERHGRECVRAHSTGVCVCAHSTGARTNTHSTEPPEVDSPLSRRFAWVETPRPRPEGCTVGLIYWPAQSLAAL